MNIYIVLLCPRHLKMRVGGKYLIGISFISHKLDQRWPWSEMNTRLSSVFEKRNDDIFRRIK